MGRSNVVVVGGGAAGLLAAAYAANRNADVLLLEKNNMLACKIRISGKGRCNLTNATDLKDFIDSYYDNGKFLYPALITFSNQDLIRLLFDYGLETKIERGNRVFPVSDNADHVAETLIKFAEEQGVRFRFNTKVTKVCVNNNCVIGVESSTGYYPADKVIITTGGASYPKTGSTGDGYEIAKMAGHTIIEPYPALVGLKTSEDWVKDVSGLTLKNVSVTIYCENEVRTQFGEMEFAHFGVTGPIILTLSHYVSLWLRENKKVTLTIDLKPALSELQLDKRIQRDFQIYQRKQLKNGLNDLLPKSLIPIIIGLSGLKPEKVINQITKQERFQLVHLLKQLTLSIKAPRPISTAIVTAGGVELKEINPKTMESKLISGLYFAGEVLDIDGITGGFNLQAAFSTGVLAGINACKE